MTAESQVAGPYDAPPLTVDGNSLSLHSAEPRYSPEVLSVILCSQSFPFGQSYEPKPATLLLEKGEGVKKYQRETQGREPHKPVVEPEIRIGAGCCCAYDLNLN